VKKSAKQKLRRLVVILGDQLDPRHPLIEALDPECDLVFMAEVREESTHVWSHKARIVLLLAAMRHYRDSLRARGITVRYLRLDAHCHQSLAAALNAVLQDNPPQQIAMLQAGDARVQSDLEATARQANLPLEVIEDPHFLVTATAFSDWLAQRKQPRLEHFYRALRKQTGLLMQDAAPLGGRWNFDADNRASFGKQGPVQLPLPPAFSPDRTTREVIALVNREFPEHPGVLDSFDWPTTPDEAQLALQDFIDHRLALFGTYEDAMWTAQPFLYHSLLSPSLNLKLLNPRAMLHAAEQALQEGRAPLASVEGFVRQILGWREYVHGIYWARMPAYAHLNELQAERDLPAFFWNADTDMVCLREVLAQAIGADACPFTTLYWDFLSRHQERFAHHPRMALQWRNLQRIDTESLRAIRPRAESLRALF
jgi:deoxyribodipyrimidine photolyase-related protein